MTIAIASRAGVYAPGVVPKLLREGRVIKYWAHALCLLPAEDWLLSAWARERMRDGPFWRLTRSGEHRGGSVRTSFN